MFYFLSGQCAGETSVSKAIARVRSRNPLHPKCGVFVLRTWEPEEASSTGFSRRRERLERAEHLAAQAWTARKTPWKENIEYS